MTAGRFGDIYRSSISEGLIELYTCNYQYPLLKKNLPLDLTYFGCFSIEDLGLIADKTTYSTYFGDGVFSVYTKLSNKTVMFNSDEEPAFNGALLEWYRSWGNLQEFSLYRHLYFPLDRDHSSWMNLHSLTVNFYPHPDMVSSDKIWEDCESFNLTTIDFVKTETKVNLLSVDPSIWDEYTQQQALFRYYDVSTGEIGFWTPKDLILNHEAIRIAKLLGKQPEEVLAIFQNWLYKAGTPPSLYLNYIGSETYGYVKDAWHEVEYVY